MDSPQCSLFSAGFNEIGFSFQRLFVSLKFVPNVFFFKCPRVFPLCRRSAMIFFRCKAPRIYFWRMKMEKCFPRNGLFFAPTCISFHPGLRFCGDWRRKNNNRNANNGRVGRVGGAVGSGAAGPGRARSGRGAVGSGAVVVRSLRAPDRRAIVVRSVGAQTKQLH